MNSILDLDIIEYELNHNYYNNPDIKMEDIQIFQKISDYSYYPIDYYIKDDEMHLVEDTNLLHSKIFVGSKRQYINTSFPLSTDSNMFTFDTTLATAWNKDKFVIFVDGKFIGRERYKILIPNNDNTYKYKKIIFDFSLKGHMQLDVIYIENGEVMDNVPYNRDLLLSNMIVRRLNMESEISYGISTSGTTSTYYPRYLSEYYLGDRRRIKVPYPYTTYPRGKHTFFVFHSKYQHLIEDEDYTISRDGEYITLVYDKRLGETTDSINSDYLDFVFPYVKASWEGVDDAALENGGSYGANSGSTFKYSNSVSSDTSTGTITFYPKFNQYTLTKRDILIFGNTTFIDPDKYDLVDNGTIRFKNDYYKKHCDQDIYTMMIFAENGINKQRELKRHFEFYTITGTAGQVLFQLPRYSKVKDFLVFRGSVLMEQENRYIWNQQNSTITLTNSDDSFVDGNQLQVVYYVNNNEKSIEGVEITSFDVYVETAGTVELPSILFDSLKFTKNNLMIYVNTTYIEPERYNIDRKNNLTFVDSTDGGNTLRVGKVVHGIVLKRYIDNIDGKDDSNDHANSYVLMKDDHDYIWFDEIHAKIHT